MALDEVDLVHDIVRRLLADDARVREVAGDVTDVMRSLGPFGPVVAGVLVVARLAESDPNAQGSQLHAVAEMHEWDLVPAYVRELVGRVELDHRDPSQEEYLDYLLDRDGDTS